MTNLKRVIWQGMVVTLVLFGTATGDEVRELTWEEMIPEGEVPEQPALPVAPHSDDLFVTDDWKEDSIEQMFLPPPQPIGVVEELDGVLVKLPGFIVPLALDGEGKVEEFLLVPYFGACIHYPPPPANQMVFISTDDPIEMEMTWGPIWVTGEIKTTRQRSEYGAVEYSMAAQTIEEYTY